MGASTNTNTTRLVDLAANQLRTLLEAGREHACETVFEHYPLIAQDRDSALEIIYLEYVFRQDKGDFAKPTVEEYVGRFPAFREDIVKLLQVDAAFQSMGIDNPTLTGDGADTLDLEESIGVIGDYRLLEVLGRGGMGLVYRAIQQSLGRVVALKTIVADEVDSSTLARFQKEAELASSLQHPNIAQIYEVGKSETAPFYSMEYVAGGNLAQFLRDRPLKSELAARLLTVLARAVEYAHSQGVVHRDLKPANILLSPSARPEALELPNPFQLDSSGVNKTERVLDGNMRLEPKIADFGLAFDMTVSGRPEPRSRAAGTPSYMAPEQIDSAHGTPGPATDIYALGAILYHALVGRPPFNAASTQETLRQVQFDEIISPRRLQPRIASDLETICLKCLRKAPASRYASALELAEDLQRFLDGKPIHARPASMLEVVFKWGKRHPSLVFLMASMLVAMTLTTWLWQRSERSLSSELQERRRSEQLEYDRDINLAHLEIESHNIERAMELLQQCNPKFRNWEWHFLNRLCDEPVWQCKSEHDGRLTSAALSPDGKLVATSHGGWGADYDQTIYVWDTEKNKLLWELKGHPVSSVMNLSFSPDGTRLLSSAIVWKLAPGAGNVMEWDMKTGKLIRTIADTNSNISIYTADQKNIIVGQINGVVSIYHWITGDKIKDLAGHRGMVLSICVSPDGKYVLSSARDGTVCLREAGTWNLVQKFENMGDPRIVAWSPDGRQAQVVSYGGRVDTFQWTGGELRYPTRHARQYTQNVSYAPDSRTYATAVYGETADLRDLESGRILRRFNGHGGNVRSLCFDKSGYRLLTAGSDGTCRLWDLTRKDLHVHGTSTTGRVSSIDFHPTQNEFAVSIRREETKNESASGSPRIEIWDSDKHYRIAQLTGHADWLTSVRYSEDGKRLVSASLDKSVRVWDRETKKEIAQHALHIGQVLFADFVDESRIVSVDESGNAIVWNVADQKVESQSNICESNPQDPEWIRGVDYHVGSAMLAVATRSDIHFWDVTKGVLVKKLHVDSEINVIRFNRAGLQIAVGSQRNEVLIYDLSQLSSSGIIALRHRLKGHSEPVTNVTFSPDGQRLVSGGRDDVVRMFELQLGNELLKRDDFPGIDHHVAFSRNGKQFLHIEGRQMFLYSLDEIDPNKGLSRVDKTIAYHRAQLKDAQARLQFFGALFHSQAIVDLQPERDQNRIELIQCLADVGKVREAQAMAESFQAAKDSIESDRYLAQMRNCLLLHDYALYRQRLKEYEKLAEKTDKPSDWNNVGWYGALLPDTGVDLERAITKLKPAVKSKKNGNYQNTIAMMYYRLGKYNDAYFFANASRVSNQTPFPMDDMIECLGLCRDELSFVTQVRALVKKSVAEGKIDITEEVVRKRNPEHQANSVKRTGLIQARFVRFDTWKKNSQVAAETRVLPKLSDLRVIQSEYPVMFKEIADMLDEIGIPHKLAELCEEELKEAPSTSMPETQTTSEPTSRSPSIDAEANREGANENKTEPEEAGKPDSPGENDP